MKTNVVILLVLFLTGCHRRPVLPSIAARQYFITGTYATWERGNLSRSWDTLIITRYDNNPRSFSVIRISYFQRTIDPNFYPPAFVHTHWVGMYDPATHVLSSPDGRPDLLFIPDQYVIRVGALYYVRTE